MALPIQTTAPQAAVFDFFSNTMLLEHNIDEQIAPSSMTNLMTLYVTFYYIKAGFVKMEDKFKTSKEAWQKGGNSIFLRAGQLVAVRDLINGIITTSANDACITLAEGVAGSQENFVDEMNRIAQKLNLTKSHFSNVIGAQDKNQFMSIRDLITLTVRIFEDFPEYYHLFSKKDFKYNNIYQENINLLSPDNRIDGIISIYTDAGGYGSIVAAKHEGRRIFILISGLKTEKERISEIKQLLDYAFNDFSSQTIFHKGSKAKEIIVKNGDAKYVEAVFNNDVIILYPKGSYDTVKTFFSHENAISAPVKKGQEVGHLHIQVPELTERVIPMYAANDINHLNFFQRILYMFSPKTDKVATS
ncbi:D-alanyl-D-alanine carboxypeptidase family protein [Ehrlichia chaffeensis str. Heartland]|uniref:D-alanyl-D-alanine carboxypeptidase family protein n=1 Tax=Ehrlichia chaffeensis TaxID=945 RepID=UPI0002FAA43F|nr:D-alanyl-D-alanine carboxypeptidase family protein [Ehrlichia chaffeensis]AHX03282.1 D-alanyl-D-alanine carboxypeptidase family protein [Ehrlichia chaffeensis str. Heartland]AHX05198.1 D-alanyl-D-alanine carboxypeptidase family protein [Ehrlichia chaffeensis str. Jax]AHX06188.1 D-alanyl-D-alanine carboxypeptidase family protein [Ehrlichia chaffeensis str. Liberty]AHX07454.1 D-alanyl-D-alanine carboxypeptidase family protein [Ehrlichia chaffeensis str. Osceola]AHX08816.1 D-alanyl-D-alanine c